MRVDAHQNFWELNRFFYPWMPAGPGPLRHDYLPDRLRVILARNKFDGSVAVQATTDAREAQWLLGLADEYPFILGVVAWVDLTDSRLGDDLDRLQRHPRFKGVRHPVHDETDERWLLRPDVISGLEELQRRDIPYDLLLRPHHLPLIPKLVEKIPQLRMVIDHLAKPDIRNHMWEPWASDMERVSAFPHIYLKISGMITEADPAKWTAADLTPYVQYVLKLFGVERCMFGSDWPVCFLASSAWKQVLAAFTQAHGPIAKESRVKITGETAAKFYGLEVPEHPVTL